MKSDELLLYGGKIEFFDLHEVDVKKTVEEQIDLFKEDLLQIKYPNGHILDLGWYPSFDIEGCFKLVIIKNYDWDFPIKSKKIKPIYGLIDELNNFSRLASGT